MADPIATIRSMADPDFARLTPRQRESLRGLAALKSAKAIGRDLGISESTVYGHLDGAAKVLGAPDRSTAALWLQAHERGDHPQLGIVGIHIQAWM